MDDVVDTRHLERRGDLWHYRRRVPTQYVDAVGKAVARHSLGTATLKQARILRDELRSSITGYSCWMSLREICPKVGDDLRQAAT